MPQEFAVAYRPARAIRTAIVRGALILLGASMLLFLRLLEREHPTRVFITGRLSESIPAIDRSLCQGGIRNWFGEAFVGSVGLFGTWTLLDYLIDSLIGPFELGALLLSLAG